MTLQQLQRLVAMLSNQLWVRHWIHWNYPANPPKMALSCVDVTGKGIIVYEYDLPAGWTREEHDNKVYYIWDRVDEQGNPWETRVC